jgi:predicted N-acetyltransferase YhbS
MQLEVATPLADARIGPLLDAAFQRPGSESLLAAELARHYPDYDPGLSLVATENGAALGYALFFPRTFRLSGAFVRCGVLAPLGVHPGHQRRGIGRFLVRAGLAALKDRGVRAAVVLGASEYYGAFGWESAFNVYTSRAPVQLLPDEGDTSSWRGLAGSDLGELCAIQSADYARCDGTELRRAAPIDWESRGAEAHTLVLERSGRVAAWLRFRVRGDVELAECGARDASGRDAILRCARRLLREHRRGTLLAHLPPPHPVARALFERGATSEANRLAGAAQLAVLDAPAFFADTHARWLAALDEARAPSASFAVGGRTWRIAAIGARLDVSEGRDERHHVDVPAGWSSALITGQRDFLDLARANTDLSDPPVDRLARALFPGGAPQWTYAPVFDVVDE